MKLLVIVSSLVVAIIALCGSATQIVGDNATNSSTTLPSLSWSGNIPGHGAVTLYGSAESVHEQIFALQPALREAYVLTNTFMSPTPRSFNASQMVVSNFSYSWNVSALALDNDFESSVLEARQAIVDNYMYVEDGPSDTHWYCGNFATGNYEEAYQAIATVTNPGGLGTPNGYWILPGAIVTPPVPFCLRMACSGSTAVYWCNDKGTAIEALSIVLGAVASMVAGGFTEFGWTGCCLFSQNSGAHNQFSGQVFIGNGTNIVVGYGNCSSPGVFVPPSDLPTPGPNGVCV